MAGRPKKIIEEVETNEVEAVAEKEISDVAIKTDAEIKLEEAMAMMAKMSAKMEEMQKKIDDSQSNQPIVIKQERGIGAKKIKCINLRHGALNVATAEWGKGKVYEFNGYGDSKMINGDHLYMICEAYPNTINSGLLYIADSDFIEEIGLSELYEQNVYNKETIDKISLMRTPTDLDMYLSMNDIFKENIAGEIARNIASGETVDMNYLTKIKQETGHDIFKVAEEIKEENKGEE